MAVKLGGAKDYSAIQGPAPSGFHVPTKDEWEALYDAFTGLGLSSSADWQTYFKMPYAGYRKRSDASVESQGYWGYYWASSVYTNVANSADCFRFNSSQLYPSANLERSIGESIRPFKDVPVPAVGGEIILPGWTRLYGNTMTGNVIAWNSTEGLISICSDDGNTWITIADKNLGATTVYNSGDTLSEANCGKYYQRGNNYGFAWTGTLTTSSTQVDASNYGPGNYYSSSTFIIRNGTPYGWDSSNNKDLRGRVTGIRPGDLKKCYIGENPDWKPNSHTVAYWPLNSTTTVYDQSGNSYDLTNSSGSFGTYQGVDCWNGSSTGNYLNRTATSSLIPSGASARTMSFWAYTTTNSTSYTKFLICYGGTSTTNTRFSIATNTSKQYIADLYSNYITSSNTTFNKWFLHTLTYDGTTAKYYIDGVLIGTQTQTLNTTAVGSSNAFRVNKRNNSTSANYSSSGYYSEIIIEDYAWTADQIAAYFNQTKGTYSK